MAVSIVARGCAPSSHFTFPCRNIFSPAFQRGHCQFTGGVGLSEVRCTAGLSNGASEDAWCGLCGDRGGWCTCGRCMGQGGFPTRPGLAGLKGKVGWARCKTCFGQTVVPCLFCGISEVTEWKLWLEQARRHPPQGRKQYKT